MPKRSKKRFPCGHKGYGTYCHRCQFADKLEEMLKAGEQYVTHKRKNKSTGKIQSKKWTQKQMKEEAKRLREEGKGI